MGRGDGAERIDERPFVKNLESVQGDERDVIVFSTGHAPVERTRARRVAGAVRAGALWSAGAARGRAAA
jgi:hypothetical protein